MRRLLARALVVALVALVVLAACQATPPPAPIEMTDARVTAGAPKSCADLGISDVRCTLLTLRAAQGLEAARPDADVASQRFHEAGASPAGQSPIPVSQVVTAVVVFTLEDGSRIGVPLLCPRDPSGSDRACDPRLN